MKPLHVGLLVIGAALAGGLAVKMTQPPAYHPPARVAPVAPPQSAPATEPPPAPTAEVPAVSVTAAPPPVYETVRPKPAAAPARPASTAPGTKQGNTKTVSPPASAPATSPAPAPNPPAAIAKADGPVPAPVPYQPPAETAAVTTVQPEPALESAPVAPAQPPAPLRVTLHQGKQIAVRLDQTLASDHLSPGDTFQASLAEPLTGDGFVIGERGARVWGKVVDSRQAGRLGGVSSLQLALTGFQTADGQRVAISTEPWLKQGDSARNQDVATIGGGAALGAIIGAIAGGGKGAAIGAGVGGAAGTGAAAATRGKPVSIPSETVIRFRLSSRVSITERQL